MRKTVAIIIFLAAIGVRNSSVGLSAETTRPTTQAAAEGVRFEYVDVYVDPHGQALAAWQVELKVMRGDVKFVGIEGGDEKGFQNPPYYDPAALTHEGAGRIVLGAFSLSEKVPVGKTRVARVMVRVVGERPAFAVRVMAAGAKDGKAIGADATVLEGAAR